jgi:hypothetical protein
MFKCVELPWLVQFFLMFYNDKPVDWLLDHMIHTKICSLDKDSVSIVQSTHCPIYWKALQSHQLTLFVSETLQESQVAVVDSLQTISFPTHWHSFIIEREGSETKGLLAVFTCNQSYYCTKNM